MQSRSTKPVGISVILALAVAFVIDCAQPVAAEEDPWQFLNGFSMVTDSPALIEDHYVAALFISEDQRQLAVVIFNATCDSSNCEIHHRAAYSLFDRQGANIRRYIDPGDQELRRLIAGRLGG